MKTDSVPANLDTKLKQSLGITSEGNIKTTTKNKTIEQNLFQGKTKTQREFISW